MAYKKYKGNSGNFIRVMEPKDHQRIPGPPPISKNPGQPVPVPGHNRNPLPSKHKQGIHFPGFKIPDMFGGLFKNLGIGNLESEDILLILILLFLYKESGDIELLIILGVLLFL
ncbi:MAG TPA: hypothetical protein GXZ52_05765 [Clostridiales bacterium]|nr:hypothetical protein [Clostridiales bacterium]